MKEVDFPCVSFKGYDISGFIDERANGELG